LSTTDDIVYQLFQRIPNRALGRQLEATGNWENLSIPTLVSFFGEDVVFPRARGEEVCDSPLQHLGRQFQEAEDFIRALLFTYLPKYRQKQAMLKDGGFFEIPVEKLVEILDKNWHALLNLKTKLDKMSINIWYDYRRGLGKAPLDYSMACETDDLAPAIKEGLRDDWGRVHKHEEHPPLPMLPEERSALQQAALG
jgi:hypothetical protein